MLFTKKDIETVQIGSNDMPEPPKSFTKLIGPSIVLLGLGLGTGELILWPYLVSNYGLGIIWGALLGITMQYFINLEIERYTLANGESIFVGFKRLNKKFPYWFILATALAWCWPGFSAMSAQIFSRVFLISNVSSNTIAIVMLLLVGLILTLGPTLYKTMEQFTKTIIIISVPIIIFLVIKLADLNAYESLLKGLVGQSDDYLFFPKSLPLLSFLAAFTYSGAGGTLNLAQSFYIKSKGYGMGRFSGQITSLLTGKEEKIKIVGETFKPTAKNISRFNTWWRLINQEHFFVFWFLGLTTILALALISYSTTYKVNFNNENLNFLFMQAGFISYKIGSVFGFLMLLVTCIMLFQSQLTVIDAAGRIITENFLLIEGNYHLRGRYISKCYYISIWMLVLFGISMFLLKFDQPKTLILMGAVLNAFSMFSYTGFLNKINTKFLHKAIRPSNLRKTIIYITFVFLGCFSFAVLITDLLPYAKKLLAF